MRSGFSARLSARLSVVVLAACVFSLAAAAAVPAVAGRPAERQEGRATERAAVAAPSSDLGDMLFGRAPADTRSPAMPRLARFRSDSGDTFILEVTARGPAYLKYDDSGEVWSLNPTTGSRGDTIYKNDVGEAMLRTTRLGGVTVFTQDHPGGAAAAVEGGGYDLHNMISGPIAMLRALVQASARASQISGHRVEFEAGCPARSKAHNGCPAEADLMPGSEWVFADAANLAAQAFSRVDRLGRAGHEALSRYDKVAFFNGHPPSVSVVGDEVRIVVTPELGFSGRPSSQRISQILFRR